ncbi:MAG: TetR/AcrR family transcriptional regulator [Candidatus Obscuribacterales bacterium]|nr:TetR/AcrR family transcriptional regulator [Candidatus Obscuribacterales bacterium]
MPKSLKPRKTPIQERSGQTVEAIFEATIQVLLKDGVKNLTTTRVAERAGVSVGSLYQYYPNKEALLIAMLEKHLDIVGATCQIACRESHNLPLDAMMANIIDAFVDAKMKKKDISLAIAELISEVSCVPMYTQVVKQIEIELTTMLGTLPGVQTEKIPFVVSMMLATMGGATKMVMDRMSPPHLVKRLKQTLQAMFTALIKTELLFT